MNCSWISRKWRTRRWEVGSLLVMLSAIAVGAYAMPSHKRNLLFGLLQPAPPPQPQVIVVPPPGPAPPPPVTWAQLKAQLIQSAIVNRQAQVQAMAQASQPPTVTSPQDGVALAAASSGSDSGLSVITSNPLSISVPQITASGTLSGSGAFGKRRAD